jgi:ABC-2 type transport system permease protein
MGTIALIGRSVGRVRAVMAGVIMMLSVFQVVLVLMARSIARSGSLQALVAFLPAAFQRSLGSGMLMLTSFAGIVRFGFVHPVIVLTVVMTTTYLALDPAIDVEQGLVDLMLARPLSRHQLITRSSIVMLGGSALMVAAMMLAQAGALALFARSEMWPEPVQVAAMGINLAALGWCFGAFALLVAAGTRRAPSAFSVAAITAICLDLLEYVSASWPPAARLSPLSPFHYYRGLSITPWDPQHLADLTVLTSASAVLVAGAYWRFARRDV